MPEVPDECWSASGLMLVRYSYSQDLKVPAVRLSGLQLRRDAQSALKSYGRIPECDVLGIF